MAKGHFQDNPELVAFQRQMNKDRDFEDKSKQFSMNRLNR